MTSIIRDVSYGPHPRRHLLDIYIPKPKISESSQADSSAKTTPLVIHVHGGGWQRGDKNNRWRGAPVAGESLSGACPLAGAAHVRDSMQTAHLITASAKSSPMARSGSESDSSTPLASVASDPLMGGNSSNHLDDVVGGRKVFGSLADDAEKHDALEDIERAGGDAVVVAISYRLAPVGPFSAITRSIVLSIVLTLLVSLICLPFGWLTLIGGVGILFIKYVFPAILSISCLHSIITTWVPWFGMGRHPIQVEDVANAVRWVRDHIHEFAPQVCAQGETQPRHVFLSGHSAGAHLISLLVTDDQKYLRAAGVPSDFIRGVIAVSGVFTMTGPLASDSHFLNRLFSLTYASSALGMNPDTWVDASPIHHIHSRIPPFLVLSAESDMGLEHDARRFVDKLHLNRVPHEYHVVPGTSHASIASKLDSNGAALLSLRFIHRLHNKSDSSMTPKLPIALSVGDIHVSTVKTVASPKSRSRSTTPKVRSRATSPKIAAGSPSESKETDALMSCSQTRRRGLSENRISLEDVEDAAQKAAEAVGL